MACEIWLRRNYLLRHCREPAEPPCGHDPELCPPPAPHPCHRYRCGGVRMCGKCQWEASRIHDAADGTETEGRR